MCVGVCVILIWVLKKSSTIHKSSFCEIEYKPSMQIAACNRQTESNWQSNEIILCVVFIFFFFLVSQFSFILLLCSVLFRLINAIFTFIRVIGLCDSKHFTENGLGVIGYDFSFSRCFFFAIAPLLKK